MLVYNLGNFAINNGTIDHTSMNWCISRLDERTYLMIQQQRSPNYIIARLIIVPERFNITQVPQMEDAWLLMTYIDPRPMHLIALSPSFAILLLFTPNSTQIDMVPIHIDVTNTLEPVTMTAVYNNFFQNPAWTDTQPKFINNDLQFCVFPDVNKAFFLLNTYDTHRNLYLFELDYNSTDPTNPIFHKTWTLIKSYGLTDNYNTQLRIFPINDEIAPTYTQFAVFCLNLTNIITSDILIYNNDGTLYESIDCSGIPTYSTINWTYPSIDPLVIRIHDDKGNAYIEYIGSSWSNTPVVYSSVVKNPFYRENLDAYHTMEISTTATTVGHAGDLSLRVIRKINNTLGILSQASMLDPNRNIVVQTGVIVEDRPWQHYFFKYAFDLYVLFFRKYQTGGTTSTDWTNSRDYYIIFLDAQNS